MAAWIIPAPEMSALRSTSSAFLAEKLHQVRTLSNTCSLETLTLVSNGPTFVALPTLAEKVFHARVAMVQKIKAPANTGALETQGAYDLIKFLLQRRADKIYGKLRAPNDNTFVIRDIDTRGNRISLITIDSSQSPQDSQTRHSRHFSNPWD
jgi:hypothetical protein